MNTIAISNFKSILGDQYNPTTDYQLVFPSSVANKALNGWRLVKRHASEIMGQELVLIGKERTNEG